MRRGNGTQIISDPGVGINVKLLNDYSSVFILCLRAFDL
jgi:hypothetical protein